MPISKYMLKTLEGFFLNAQHFFLSVSENAKKGKQEMLQVKHSVTWWMKVIDIFPSKRKYFT